ncbi:MAG: hypothetical protein LH615_06350 [Ferruginibacter sp.]|nr:hypothetical protein [Ferruginibacter sp.]
MQTSLQVNITFEQVLNMVKQLPIEEKLMLTKELEKEGIESKLDAILQHLKTDELDKEMIDGEVEMVRKNLYDNQKHEGNF